MKLQMRIKNLLCQVVKSKWCMWFLFIAIVVFVKQAIDVYQMVGNEINPGHVLILCRFAMLIHGRQFSDGREITLRQTESAESEICKRQYCCQFFYHCLE